MDSSGVSPAGDAPLCPYFGHFHEDIETNEQMIAYYTQVYQLMGKISFVLYIDPENKEFLEAKDMLDKILYEFEYDRMPF